MFGTNHEVNKRDRDLEKRLAKALQECDKLREEKRQLENRLAKKVIELMDATKSQIY